MPPFLVVFFLLRMDMGALMHWHRSDVKMLKKHKSRLMRKLTICICETKDPDQLRSNREADQHLCFRYIDSTMPLLSRSKISSL